MQPMVLAFNPLDSVSEFFKNLMNNFCKAMYDGLYSVADAQFKGMFESLNDMISDSHKARRHGVQQHSVS